MTPSLSVVIPVKDGARYLGELLDALGGQPVDEVLVIDSGSHDGSAAIARRAGAEVIEIAPAEFGHGRTRNLGAAHTRGELIAFLTQDATPLAGWADAYREAFALGDRIGAAYGPHRPRPDTSPMIARELEQFFAGFAPDGVPVVQRAGDPAYLSNVNACYARACWEQVRFEDVPYAEDQAFGTALLEAGWAKVFHPRAAVLHAHDYPPVAFMRRYFDEYRGLRQTIGHVEGFGVRSSARVVRDAVAGDRAWLRTHGASERELARWTARSLVHHSGRRVFSALGSRAERLPAPVRAAISLEGRADAAVPAGATVARGELRAAAGPGWYEPIGELEREGPVPLLDPLPGAAERACLHFAVVIPYFRRGSGGHASIFQLLLRLERMGHTCSIWVHDPIGYHGHERPAVLQRNIREWFAPLRAPVFKDLSKFYGADVVVATGWETVYPVMRLRGCRARAYLVHDHENEFFPTSIERIWAEDTYRMGLFHICASPWLRALVKQRYGGRATEFQFGVDHDVYRPRPVPRDPATIVFYARSVTPRRAVPLGLLALAELRRRRPGVRIQLFGDVEPVDAPFDAEHLGVLEPAELSWVYSRASVGLCLSLTNYSLIPQEMLACGLPCVDLAGFSAESVFGEDGPVELAPSSPGALADAIERLLDDGALWHRRSEAGMRFVADHTWDAAAAQVEAGLREALREREPA